MDLKEIELKLKYLMDLSLIAVRSPSNDVTADVYGRMQRTCNSIEDALGIKSDVTT